MSALTVPAAGQGIQASWGAGVANYINDHASAITANVGAITTTETVVRSLSLPANSLQAGSTFRVTAYGQGTSTVGNAVTFRIRCGTTTLTGNILVSLGVTATAAATSNAFMITGIGTIRATGASAASLGGLTMVETPTQPFTVANASATNSVTVTVNTTVANLIEFTAVTAAATTSLTFYSAVIEALKP